MPPTSGNAINGHGEAQRGPPRPIYWHDPDILAHGELQRWFYTRDPDNPLIREAREQRAQIIAEPVPPVQGEPQQRSPQDWSASLAAFAQDEVDLDLFGVTEIRPEWVFEGCEVAHRRIIMIGVAHDHERLRTAPSDAALVEVIRQYGRGTRAAKAIAGWIRRQGWDATPHGGPMAGPLLMIPPAIECGFGELGKHGSIINREYGSAFRLACVTTDLPLLSTPRQDYGVDDFCSRCQVCSNACPPAAILPEKQLVRGEHKWYVDFDKCVPYFNESYGCGICIAVCPWSIPGRGPRIVEQLMRRAERGRG